MFTPVFKDGYVEILDEKSLAVTDLPYAAHPLPTGKKYKLIYIANIGSPLSIDTSGAGGTVASLFAGRATLMVELVTSVFNLYADLAIRTMLNSRPIGTIIDGYSEDQDDFLTYLLDGVQDDTTYGKKGDAVTTYAFTSTKTLKKTDNIYVCIWLGARNMTGSIVSGTVKCKNLKATWTVGPFSR